MRDIALFYLRKDVGGGSTSFAAHLYRSFVMAGISATLYRVRPQGVNKRSNLLAKYDGVTTKWITAIEALDIAKRGPSLLVAPDKAKNLPGPDFIQNLMQHGMRIVIHDPNEFKVYDHLGAGRPGASLSLPSPPICIRPTMKKFYRDAMFIHHPFVLHFSSGQSSDLHERKPACSLARVTFVKRPMIIFRANAMLRKKLKIEMHGAENRMFTKFVVMKEFPDYRQGGHGHEMTWGSAQEIAKSYALAVDMTYFPDDGGGSQYSFMEAWDAGAVNIIHEDWLRYPGEMVNNDNCLTVAGPNQLADLIRGIYTGKGPSWSVLKMISRAGYAQLRDLHDPVKIARRYAKELSR